MKNGLHCSAGYDWFSIGSEGRVSVCNALLYRTDSGIYLGNILTDDIKLRGKDEWFRCPKQECTQICDRHWARKRVYKDDVIIDEQDVVSPLAYEGKSRGISVMFAPKWECNYSCKYCGLPTKKIYPTIPDVCDTHPASKWVEGFDRFFNTNGIDGGIWHTAGGEPLYYDEISVLFKYFYDKKFKIALTTNTSADVYEKIVRVVPPEAFIAINCSLHPSDKNFRIEMFKSRVQLLKSLGYPVSVNFVGHPDQITLAMDYWTWCKSINVGFALIPLFGSYFNTVEDYPEPLRKIIYEISREDLRDSNKFLSGKRVTT